MLIAEVSAKYDLSADTLRYYERVGLIPQVQRNKSGLRDYTEENCRWVEFVKCMRAAGLPIEVLIDYVSMFQQGDSTISARKELLIDQRKKLVEKLSAMQTTIERLDYKIKRYEIVVVEKENELKNSEE